MAQFQPDGWPTVTPRIVTPDPQSLVMFLREVFGARGDYRAGRPAEMRIGDSVVMVSGEDSRASMPAFLYVYVEDTDATFQRAIAAKAVTLAAPADLPYGDRRAMVKDPWGNVWQIATHQENLTEEQIVARLGDAR